jgi:hypothetical protein
MNVDYIIIFYKHKKSFAFSVFNPYGRHNLSFAPWGKTRFWRFNRQAGIREKPSASPLGRAKFRA